MLRFVADSEEGSDIVGTLTIGDASRIEVESAYLDSWLAGLLECIAAVSQGALHHEVDLIEESTPLIAETAGGEVLLRFDDQVIRLGPLAPAVDAITSDARELLHRHRPRNEVLVREIDARLLELTAPASEH